MLAKLAVSSFASLILTMSPAAPAQQNPAAVTPLSLAKVTTIDSRFQSYNIEILEVTGGRFWKPYKAAAEPASPAPAQNVNTPANTQSGKPSFPI